MLFALARVLVNALVLFVFSTVRLTCPEVGMCVSGNAAAVYSYTINAHCITLVQHFYNLVYHLYTICITFV